MSEKLQPSEIEGKGRPVVVIVHEEFFVSRWKKPFESGPFEVITVVPRDYVDLKKKLIFGIDEETRNRIALVLCHCYWERERYSSIIRSFIYLLRETNEEAVVVEVGNTVILTRSYRGVNASVETVHLNQLLGRCPEGSADAIETLRKHIFFDKDYSFAMNIAEETDGWGRKPESFFEKPPEERTQIFDDYLEKLFTSPRYEGVFEKIGCDEDNFRKTFWELPEMERIDLIHLVFKELNLLYAKGEMHDLDIQRIQGILCPKEAFV